MKNVFFITLCIFALNLFSSCQKEDDVILIETTPGPVDEPTNLTEEYSFTSNDVAKLSKAENTSEDAILPTIWEWTSERCDSLATAMHFQPLCHERVVLDVVDTISMRFFPEVGKQYEILFIGYQIDEQGHFTPDGYTGWGGHGGGGTCTRWFPNYRQWEIVYGYSYADGVLVAASVYDMRSGDQFASPPVVWAR